MHRKIFKLRQIKDFKENKGVSIWDIKKQEKRN